MPGLSKNAEQTQLLSSNAKPNLLQPPLSINSNSKPSKSFILASSFRGEIWLVFQRSILMSFQMLFELGVITVAIIFVGQLPNSALYLSGVGFARTFVNVTGTAMAWGFTTSLFTLLPQSIGAGHTQHAAIHIQRSFYIVTIVSALLSILQLHAGDIMVAIGQPAELKPIVNTYCRYLIPYIFMLAYCSILQRLLQALDMNKSLLCCTLLMFVCCPPLTWMFMDYLQCGYYGAAIAQNIVMLIFLLSMFVVLIYKGFGYIFMPLSFRIIWTKKGIYHYLALAIPGLFQNAFEWIIQEASIILAGYVANPTIALSTTVILNNLFIIPICFSVAICNATNIRVGKYIGKGTIIEAKRAAWCGVLIAICIMFLIVILYACGVHVLPRIYTDNKETIRLTSQMMYILMAFSCGCLICQTVGGIYRGLGIQKIAAIFVFVAYWLISLPLSIVLLFVLDMRSNLKYGVTVIWSGLAVGNILAAIAQVIYLVCCSDWKTALHRSNMRIKNTMREYHSTKTFDH